MHRLLTAFIICVLVTMAPVGVKGQEPAGPAAPPEAPAEAESANANDRETRIVRFQSMARFQVEVWLNGQRAGFTPLQVRLPDGDYIMTATADSLAPIVQPISVGEGVGVVWIPPIPVTRDNYRNVTRDVVRHIFENPENPHLIIASLLLTIDPEDARDLLQRADSLIPGDPMVDIARAGHLLRDEKHDEALRAAERALEKLGNVAFSWRRLAEVHHARGEHAEALEAINRAVVIDPRGWRNLRIRTRIHEAMGNSNAARIDHERAEELYTAVHRIQEGLEN